MTAAPVHPAWEYPAVLSRTLTGEGMGRERDRRMGVGLGGRYLLSRHPKRFYMDMLELKQPVIVHKQMKQFQCQCEHVDQKGKIVR